MYSTDVAVRWSDMDAFGHVNHARVVTLLEEARAALLFDAAVSHGVAAFEAGLLVASLDVRYRRPIPWSTGGVRVEMVVTDLRAASFRVEYRLLIAGPGDGAERSSTSGNGSDGWDPKPAAEAGTQLVPYDLATERPRRLTPEERTFLEGYVAG